MIKCEGRVHSIESMGLSDGPGVRFVVFLSGCNLRCRYCHNPDTWSHSAGECYTADELLKKALRCAPYWGKDLKKGGVTVSGGEPLLQLDFLIEFFKKLKEKEVSTVIDTSGEPFSEDDNFLKKFDELLSLTDLVLLDLKAFSKEKHKSLTGKSNKNILKMAEYLSKKKTPVWIRYVYVPTLTDDEKEIKKLSGFIKTLSNVEKIEVLPYHTLGVYKWEKLRLKYSLAGINAPTNEEIKKAEELLTK